MSTKYCCDEFELSVRRGGFHKTIGLEERAGNWKVDIVLDHRYSDSLVPKFYDKNGNIMLYEYDNTTYMIMKCCPYCGTKLGMNWSDSTRKEANKHD